MKTEITITITTTIIATEITTTITTTIDSFFKSIIKRGVVYLPLFYYYVFSYFFIFENDIINNAVPKITAITNIVFSEPAFK